MGLNVNHAIIGGRLTADPELKQTVSGNSFTNFTIAVNRKKDKDGNVTADFLPCVAWKEAAEHICRYFKKGSQICVFGEINTRKYESGGQTRYITEIRVREWSFVDPNNNAGEGKNVASEQQNVPSDAIHMEDVADSEDLPF